MTHHIVNDQHSDKGGDLLGGFTIVGRLGAGGFGRVFKAVNGQGQAVAIKRFEGGGQTDAVAKKAGESEQEADMGCATGEASHVMLCERRAKQETEAAAFKQELVVSSLLQKLPHPGLVQFVATIKDPGDTGRGLAAGHAVVLEYCNGGNLADWIQRRVQAKVAFLTEREACLAALQLCSGLAHLHGLGVRHRDIAPRNVLMHKAADTGALHFKIADYGKSVFGEGPQSQAEIKRFASIHCAPELAHDSDERRDLDFRGDCFALGMLLYELCSLRILPSEAGAKGLRELLANDPIMTRYTKLAPMLEDLLGGERGAKIPARELAARTAERLQAAGPNFLNFVAHRLFSR